MGSSIDDFMQEEGLFEEAQAQTIAEAIQSSRQVTGPLVGSKGKAAPGSPDRENPYDDVLPGNRPV
jgi:hypothetical protein